MIAPSFDIPRLKPMHMSPESVREIGHDEFDPVGTVVLIALYVLVLVLLWTILYFVEFLGGDLTVVGVVL